MSAIASENENPHFDSEYEYVYKPGCLRFMGEQHGEDYWLDRKIFETLMFVRAGESFPTVPINQVDFAEEFDASRQSVQRSLNRLESKWGLIRACEHEPGSVRSYYVNWDFTMKRRKHVLQGDPCSIDHSSDDGDEGVQHPSMKNTNNMYFKKDDEGTVRLIDPNGIQDQYEMTVSTVEIRRRGSKSIKKMIFEDPDVDWQPLIIGQIRESLENNGFGWLTEVFRRKINSGTLSLFGCKILRNNLDHLTDELKSAGYEPSNLSYGELTERIESEEEWKQLRRGFSITENFINNLSDIGNKKSMLKRRLKEIEDSEDNTTNKCPEKYKQQNKRSRAGAVATTSTEESEETDSDKDDETKEDHLSENEIEKIKSAAFESLGVAEKFDCAA